MNRTQRIILVIFGVLLFIVFVSALTHMPNKGSFFSPVLALIASGLCFLGAASS